VTAGIMHFITSGFMKAKDTMYTNADTR